MATEPDEGVWVTEEQAYSISELAVLSGLSETELQELAEYGVLDPREQGARERLFSGRCVAAARAACRLRATFELEVHGVALVLALLQRIRGLEEELRRLHAQTPGGPKADASS